MIDGRGFVADRFSHLEHVRHCLLQFSQHRIVVLEITGMSRKSERDALVLIKAVVSCLKEYNLSLEGHSRTRLLLMEKIEYSYARSNVQRDIEDGMKTHQTIHASLTKYAAAHRMTP